MATDGIFPDSNDQVQVQVPNPVATSKVTSTSRVIDSLSHQLNSTLIANEVWEQYHEQAEKSKRDLKCSAQEDNWWVLRTSYFNRNGVMKIFCLECQKETSGDSGKHNKTNIQNLFNNFRSKHFLSANHVKNWCAHNDVLYDDHLQSIAPKEKVVLVTPKMH